LNDIQMVAAALFAIALVHTFSTKFFERLAHRRPDHAGVFHLMGEVEVVFGFWAMVLVVALLMLRGSHSATAYLDSRDFTEPMFVFAIMVVAGSRAVLELARGCVDAIATVVPLSRGTAFYFVALAFVPLLGSLITEPAAMTTFPKVPLWASGSRNGSHAPTVLASASSISTSFSSFISGSSPMSATTMSPTHRPRPGESNPGLTAPSVTVTSVRPSSSTAAVQ